MAICIQCGDLASLVIWLALQHLWLGFADNLFCRGQDSNGPEADGLEPGVCVGGGSEADGLEQGLGGRAAGRALGGMGS
jgi:hypothetical protein